MYGEKAILATEVKELQSRLLSLADERDKSLAILDEVMKFLLDGDNTFSLIVWILSCVSTPVVFLEEYFLQNHSFLGKKELACYSAVLVYWGLVRT